MSEQFYAYVICSGIDPTVGAVSCGKVGLTETQYDAQMSDPWRTWRCPSCRGPAEFDDVSFEEMHFEEIDEDSEPAF